MINESVCHLLGLSLIKDGVKGRVIAVRAGDYRTSVEVVTADGTFAQWLLSECVEAEPGALVRAIEKSSERIDRILMKSAEPPPVEEPPKPSLVWETPYDGGGWHLSAKGANYMRAPYSAWTDAAVAYEDYGASADKHVKSYDLHENCKTIAAWAREDGHIVPPHPVYGEV